MTDPANLHVTAPIPNLSLVTVIRRGFADEMARKVERLREQRHSCKATPCDYCRALGDALHILKEYQ